MKLSFRQQLRHRLICSRWQRWLLPLLCALPYVASILWLLALGEAWIAQVLLAPLLMAGMLAALTLWLADQESRN